MDSQTTDTIATHATKTPHLRSPYGILFYTLLFGCLMVGALRWWLIFAPTSAAQVELIPSQGLIRETYANSFVPIPQDDSLGSPKPLGLSSQDGESQVRLQADTRMVEEVVYEPRFDPVNNRTIYERKIIRKPVTSFLNLRQADAIPNDAQKSLESSIQQLAIQFRSSPMARREILTNELTQQLTELFDVRHKTQVSRVESLRAEVQQTQELLNKRFQLKDKIIERRLKELTGQQDELSWNTGTANLSPGAVPSLIGVPPMSPNVTMAPDESLTTASLPSFSATPIDTPRDNTPREDGSYRDVRPSSTPTLPDVSLSPLSNILPPNPEPNPSVVPSNDLPIVNATTDTPRAFMAIGFRLKKLLKDLADEHDKFGEPSTSKLAKSLQIAIEETRTVWEFEKSSLVDELDIAQSEYEIVSQQLANALNQLKRRSLEVSSGSASTSEVTEIEQTKSEIERQMLQIRSRIVVGKRSLQWMEHFEQNSLAGPKQPAGKGDSPIIGK